MSWSYLAIRNYRGYKHTMPRCYMACLKALLSCRISPGLLRQYIPWYPSPLVASTSPLLLDVQPRLPLALSIRLGTPLATSPCYRTGRGLRLIYSQGTYCYLQCPVASWHSQVPGLRVSPMTWCYQGLGVRHSCAVAGYPGAAHFRHKTSFAQPQNECNIFYFAAISPTCGGAI